MDFEEKIIFERKIHEEVLGAISTIDELARKLSKAGIKYELRRKAIYDFPFMINQIIVFKGDKEIASAICHRGSYGYDEALIEVMFLDGDFEPEGWLSPYKAYAKIVRKVAERNG